MLGKLLVIAALGGALITGQALGQPSEPGAYPPNDYGDKANWLCWPGRADACAADLTTTVIKADGSTATEGFQPDPAATIDCFYVYPTVSRDPAMISSMTIEPEETSVVVQQAARLRAHCRLYAPMYRQDTIAALTASMMHPGEARKPRPQVGYNDVKDAWTYYLAHENHGRGVVLVGHSQGSVVLTALIKNEIDGKPAQAQLVSAILMGMVVSVPAGKDVGGDFKSIPLCHAPDQLGCAIVYASFRETSPPPATSFFARSWSGDPGMEAACVNPANLAGGSGPAESYFGASIAGHVVPFQWLKGAKITTPFVSMPGLITAACVHAGVFHYLSIHLNADPSSPRTSEIPGDIVLPDGSILKDWGLHLIDANLFMGNLVDIVGAEGKAWTAARGK
jgi:hypothetical protein